MVDLISNLQNIYNKWEPWNKDVPATTSVSSAALPPSRKISAPCYGQPNNSGGPQRRKISLDHLKQNGSRNSFIQGKEALGHFKSMPTLMPDVISARTSLRNGCSRCSPYIRKSLADEVQALGLRNILMVKTQNREFGYFVRKFHHLAHIIKTNANFCYPNASTNVISNERVRIAIENASLNDMEEYGIEDKFYDKILAKHRKRAKVMLKAMKSKISVLLIRITGYVLFKVLGRLLSSILVRKSQLQMIKKLNKSTVPVVYLPLHRSHLDYILVTFILFNYEIKAPLVAAGDNLSIPVFGPLMRGLGAFFIKRKLDPNKGKKDFVYRSILHTYMEQILNDGHSLEFFIEGGRSRSGKACLPKAGLLSVVVDAFLDGSVEDIHIVPIGVSYEKLLDSSLISEQMGKPKISESFISVMKGIWSVLNGNYGSVRVDFAQPFSLREFVQASQSYVQCQPRSFLEAPSSPSDTLRRFSSTTSLYGTDIVIEDQRQLIKGLAEHVLYDAVHSTALMSTNVVCFLLLNKYRKGVLLKALIQDFNWIWDEITNRKREVGFSGSTKDTVSHALKLLGGRLVTIDMPSKDMPVSDAESDLAFIKPRLELPEVLEVSYYSNVALSAFLGDAIVASSIFALAGEGLQAVQGCDSQITISRQQLVNKALDLCNILQYEFILTPPCVSLESFISDAIQEFIMTEILLTEQENVDVSGRREWANRVARNLEWSDESEEETDHYFCSDLLLRVNLTGDSIQRLRFYRNILTPFLEGYWYLGCSLILLVQNEMEENQFVREVQNSTLTKIDQGLIECTECVAAEILKNGIKLFESWKVIDSHFLDNIKIIFLTDHFDSEEQITEVLHVLEEFKK